MKKSSLKFKKVFEDNLSSKIEKSYVLNTSKA